MEWTNLDWLTNLKSCNVNVELLRNLTVRSSNLELTDREAHTTTGTYTSCVTNEVYRDTNSDWLLRSYLEEINVKESVCNWVELELLEDSNVLLALDVEVDNVDVWSVNCLTELCEWYSESLSYWKTVLVSFLALMPSYPCQFCSDLLLKFLT